MTAGGDRRLWLIALGLSLGPAVGNGLARFAYGLVLPAMRRDLGWSYAEAGWINTANAVGYLLGALLALQWIGRIGPRPFFVGGMGTIVQALLLSAATTDFWLLTLWRVLAGVGGAPVFIAGGAMAAGLFRGDPRREALALAVYFGGGGLGLMLSGLALPVLLDHAGDAGWPLAWLSMGAAAGLALVPALWAAFAVAPPAATASNAQAAGLPLRAMAPALAGYFGFAVGYIVYLTFLVAWMQGQGAGPWLVAATWAVLGLAVMASPFPWQRVLAWSRGGAALALACAGTGAGTVLPFLVGGPAGLIASAALFGLSFFIAPTAVTSFGRKNLPQVRWAPAIALFTTVFALGQTIGPVAAGAIADRTDSLALGVAVAGLILLAAALLAACQRPIIGGRGAG